MKRALPVGRLAFDHSMVYFAYLLIIGIWL